MLRSMIRGTILIAVALGARDARSDISTPAARSSAWIERCSARFERARSQLMRQFPALGKGRIQRVTRDLSSDEKAAKGTAVSFDVEMGDELTCQATVGPMDWAEREEVQEHGGGDMNWKRTDPGGDSFDWTQLERHRGGSCGRVLVRTEDPMRKPFFAAFQRAIDDCMQDVATLR